MRPSAQSVSYARLGVLTVTLALLAAWAGRAGAAACYTTSSRMHDICPTGTDTTYDSLGSLRGAVTLVDGSRRLVYAHPNSLDVWDLTSPLNPARVTGNSLAIRSGAFTARDEDTHWYQTDHLSHIAALDGFGYAFCSLSNYGWQLLQVSPLVRWAGGYEPATPNGAPPYLYSTLFRSGTSVYLVARNLSGGRDQTLYIYLVDSSSQPASGFSSTTLEARKVARVPIGTWRDGVLANLSPTAVSKYVVYQQGTKLYLLIDANSSGFAVVDITTPSSPAALALWSVSALPALDEGPWVADSARRRLYVADTSADRVYTLNINDLSRPSLLYTTSWPGAGGSAATFLALAGDLLAVGYYKTMGYLNVGADDGPRALASQEDGITDLTRACAITFGDTVSGLDAFVDEGSPYIVRLLYGYGDVLEVAPACLDAAPIPNMSVSGPGSSCGSTADAVGYPGDTFTVVNGTTGAWSDPRLVIRRDGSLVEAEDMASNTVPWTPAVNSDPGLYTIDIEVTEDGGTEVYSTADNGTTKTIDLCGSPKASAAVITHNGVSCVGSACAWLTGDSVTLGAGNPTTTGWSLSAGHPQSFDWGILVPGGSAPASDTAAEPSLQLDAVGTYRAFVVVHYAHPTPPAGDDPGCWATTNPPGANEFFAGELASTYDSCVTLELASSPVSIGSITVSQGGSTAEPFLVMQPIAVEAPCRLASGWSLAMPVYTVDGGMVSDQTQSCSPSGGTLGGTIAADNLSQSGDHTLTLTASLSSEAGSAPDVERTKPFSVTDTVGAITWLPLNAVAGTETAFWVEDVDVEIAAVEWDFGATGCGGESRTESCVPSILSSCVGSQSTVSHTFANTEQTSVGVTASLTLAGGGTVVLAATVPVEGGACTGPNDPPPAPSGLRATAASSSQVGLSWTDNSPNESGFEIERRLLPDGEFGTVGSVGEDVTDFTDSGLAGGTSYGYRVRATNGAGSSAYSDEATATTLFGPPAAPSNLTAAAVSSSAINLAWTDNAGDETGFKIERKTGTWGTYTEIATVGAGATTFQSTGLTASTSYTYRVRATNTSGDSAYSNTATATTQSASAGVPAAPSGLSAAAASSSAINLAWTDNSSNETGFKIERKTGTLGTYSQIATVGAGVTSYQSTGLAARTSYTYRVRASNASGNSSYSNTASATTPSSSGSVPAAPSGLSAAAASSSAIDLAWTDNSSNETGFKIERKTESGSYSQIATVGAGVTSYQSTGLTASTAYTFRVRATNTTGDSSYSNEASATTLSGSGSAPAAPSGLSAAAASSSAIDLSWTDNSSNETGFKIERKTGTLGTYSQIATVGAGVTSYQSSGLAPTTTYIFRVRATNAAGDSPYSNEASATTEAGSGGGLAAPTGLTATAMSSSQINLAWTDNADGETSFKIERKKGSLGSWAQVATVGANVTSYANTGLASGTSYTYRVRASDGSSDSEYSNTASATTKFVWGDGTL